MKKAILFEPTLLAEVERKAPDLYEYYCNCPLSCFKFVNYGTKEYPMYIQKGVLELLEPLKKDESLNIPGIIMALQAGYLFGSTDLISKYPGKNIKMMESARVARTVVNICLKYPSYTIVALLKASNFDYRNGIPYSKLTYKEGQYFVAWNTIFDRYEDWNYFFVKLKKLKKSGELVDETDDNLVWDYPGFN